VPASSPSSFRWASPPVPPCEPKNCFEPDARAVDPEVPHQLIVQVLFWLVMCDV
jgi:hypothetical protein